jgi:F0F1-type ATP synthase membrane subunit c/vacuolar-type H+-ATPase subunit K
MYISSAHQTALQARYRLTSLIVIALGVSTVLYVVIGWAFAPAMPRGDYEWLTNSHYIIVGLVGVAALAVVILRRFSLSPSRLQNVGRKGISALLSQLYLCSLVGAVLGDMVGILGVVASLMTGNREYSWRLGIAALLLIAYSFPRRGEWERAIAAMETEKNSVLNPAAAAAEQIRLGLRETE